MWNYITIVHLIKNITKIVLECFRGKTQKWNKNNF